MRLTGQVLKRSFCVAMDVYVLLREHPHRRLPD